MDGAGISALVPTVGLGALPDPMGDATALLEARRRQQIEGAGYDPDKGLYDRYSAMLGTVFGPTINERAVAAREAMRRGDMATANALNQSLALDFGQFLGSIKPIRAYHGSPYDFDRFDMSKIGTGEGAQAYGHGLYFAENEGVARSYRDTLTRDRANAKEAVDGAQRALWAVQDDMAQAAKRAGASPRDGWGDLTLEIPPAIREKFAHRLAGAERDLALAQQRASNATGRMYEVNIHADPERFLDWDKPLAQQSETVRKQLPSVLDPHNYSSDPVRRWGSSVADGGEMYRALADKRLAEARSGGAASSGNTYADIAGALREAGIPGIKYLDQGSRAAGDGSRNYVVFDDKLIEILRKYGIMAPMAGAGVGSLYMDGEGEGM
jgi:hypothetical protein